jgi:DNA (cytosine-5)-methyltransferase 1
MLFAGPPCQPFSVYSYRYGAADKRKRSRDARWGLLQHLARLAVEVRPEFVVMENVPELSTQRHRVLDRFVASLAESGYEVTSSVVSCARFGVPQTRERLVLIASLLGSIDLVPPLATEAPTVRRSIGHMPPLEAGAADDSDPLHRSAALSEINRVRIASTPEGGSWRDWPDELKLACHLRPSGKFYGSVYGRMSWNQLAPTITTQSFGFGNGRFGHPRDNRALQTFPPDYQFVRPGAPVVFARTGRHIGNAVPPLLAKAIGSTIVDHLANRADAQRRPNTAKSKRSRPTSMYSLLST